MREAVLKFLRIINYLDGFHHSFFDWLQGLMNPQRIIFDRVLKARQKQWAFSNPLFLLAAGGLRREVELRLTEKIKVPPTTAGN